LLPFWPILMPGIDAIEGFGFMVGKKGANKTEVVFEQKQNQKGKLFTDLDNLLLHQKYEAAVHYVYAQEFNLDRGSYYQLGLWLIAKLQRIPEVDAVMLAEFVHNIKKYQGSIIQK